jgi:hypothetical protein
MDMETVVTDCFWCGTLWETGAYDRCPSCAVTREQGLITPTAAAANQVTDQ